MRLFFDYQGRTVLSIETDAIRDTTISSGGYSDAEGYNDYSEDPENPTFVPVQVNSMSDTPRLVNPDSRHAARISTELTINNERIVDENNGIRLLVDLTHSGNDHTFTIHRLEKFGGYNNQGQETWTNLWSLGMGSIAVSWNTEQQQEGYLFAYEGRVTDKNNQNPNVPSIGFQLGVGRLGTFTGISYTIFYQQTILNPIPTDSHSYRPTDNQVNIGGTGDGSYPNELPENLRSQVDARNSIFFNNSPDGLGLCFLEISNSHLNRIFYQISDLILDRVNSNPALLETLQNSFLGCWLVPRFEASLGRTLNPFLISDVSIDLPAILIQNRLQYKNFGTIFLNNSGWDDWNDFINTEASIYLPFVGRTNIDINDIARGSVTLEGVCDVYTGNICYWITCRNGFDEISHVYNSYTGNAAVTIPFLTVQNRSVETAISSVLPAVTQIVGGMASGNIGSILSGGASAFKGTQELRRSIHVDQAQKCNATTSLLVQWQPRLEIKRKNIIRPEHYKELKGIPTGTSGVASSFIGSDGRMFISPDQIIETPANMTAAEAKALKQLLSEGVYV